MRHGNVIKQMVYEIKPENAPRKRRNISYYASGTTINYTGAEQVPRNPQNRARRPFRVRNTSNYHPANLQREEPLPPQLTNSNMGALLNQNTGNEVTQDLVMSKLIKHCLKDLMVIEVYDDGWRNVFKIRDGKVLSI